MAVSRTKKVVHSLIANKRAMIGCLILLIVLNVAVFGPIISPHDPLKQNLKLRLKPPGWQDEGQTYWLGTDHLGRDVATRIIYGSRISLLISTTALFIGAITGIPIGLFSGYFRGAVDSVFMRIGDMQLAFPFILLIVAVIAVLGPNMKNVTIVLGLTSWVVYARIVRSEVLSLREKEFITAARALGCRSSKIIFSHLLPNVGASCIIVGTLEIARMILMESGLAFLGLGVQPPTPSWGGMLGEGRVYLYTAWWLASFSGLSITFTVLGVFLVGDWLRDFLH